jgi:uncharacterized coiled-coil DUF342 family protein
MSEITENGERLELRDAKGRTVGYLFVRQLVEELTAERDRLREEVRRLRDQLGQAEAEALRLTQEQAKLTAERDRHLKALHELTYQEFHFTPEEIADMDRNGVELRAIIEELERTLPS